VSRVAITIDVDWAPDFAIRHAAETLINNNVPCTWFITHRSQAIDELREHPSLFELGIHPNFLDGSSHGNSIDEVIEHTLDIVPDATTTRSHALYQSAPILDALIQRGLKVDVSLLLPNASSLEAVRYYSQSGSLLRIPYCYEDCLELNNPNTKWQFSAATLQESGMRVFSFHPIHIYLNSASHRTYQTVKDKYACLASLPEADAQKLANRSSCGVGDFFAALVENAHLSDGPRTIRQMATQVQ
jgi:hypothetical protein